MPDQPFQRYRRPLAVPPPPNIPAVAMPQLGQVPPAPVQADPYSNNNEWVDERPPDPMDDMPNAPMPRGRQYQLDQEGVTPPPYHEPHAQDSRGGAGETPTQTELYKKMIEAGPRRSILGTIASMGVGAAVGWSNAAGRTRNGIPMPVKAMDEWKNRNPLGPGSYSDGLKRQGTLANIEQAETKQKREERESESKISSQTAQSDYYKKHGEAITANARSAAEREKDYAENQKVSRMEKSYGNHTQMQRVAPGQPPPTGPGWSIYPSPYRTDDPGTQYAVRAEQGQEIDADTANFLGVVAGEDGKFRATPSQVNAGVRGWVKKESDANALKERGREADLRHEESVVRNKEADARLGSLNEDRQAKREERGNREADNITAARNKEEADAKKWVENEIQNIEGPSGGAKKPEEVVQRIREMGRQRIQAAYDRYAGSIRQRGGSADDIDIGIDKNGYYTAAPRAQRATPPPVAAPQAPPTAATPPPVQGGGRGGPTAPPVATPTRKVGDIVEKNNGQKRKITGIDPSSGKYITVPI